MATLPRLAPAAHAPVPSTASDGALVTNYPMALATVLSMSIPATKHHVRNANTAEPAEFPGCHTIIPRTRGPRPRPLELTQACCFKEKPFIEWNAPLPSQLNLFFGTGGRPPVWGAAAQHSTRLCMYLTGHHSSLDNTIQRARLHVFLCPGRLYCT
jgi:hypothetical protein